MAGLFKKLWHDPVWSKIISAAILGLAGAFYIYFGGWWSSIRRMGSSLAAFAWASTEIPNWLLAVLITCTALVIGTAGYAFLAPTKILAPWLSYTSDVILGIKWRWRYGDKGLIYELWAYCPACDLQIYAHNASAYHVVDRIVYYCEDCQKKVAEFEMSEGALTNLIERTIQKKIRTS